MCTCRWECLEDYGDMANVCHIFLTCYIIAVKGRSVSNDGTAKWKYQSASSQISETSLTLLG